MIRYLNQPGTPLSKKQPFTGHNNFPAMVTLLIESMNKSPAKRSNFIVVKVVHGGDRSPQYEIFKVAFASFKMNFNKNVDIQIEYLGPKEIGERRWNPRQLVDWLLECDVHIILTHLNQGRLSHSLIWCMRDLLQQMERLHYHLGYPNAQQLLCDVFTQNKGAYILKLNNDALSIPSMLIDLNEKHKYDIRALRR